MACQSSAALLAAMALALAAPEAVRRLVVADIAPVAYGHTQAPMIDAMRAVDLTAIATRRDADAQLAAHVQDEGVRAFLLQSLDVPGRRWRLNLAALSAQGTCSTLTPQCRHSTRRSG